MNKLWCFDENVWAILDFIDVYCSVPEVILRQISRNSRHTRLIWHRTRSCEPAHWWEKRGVTVSDSRRKYKLKVNKRACHWACTSVYTQEPERYTSLQYQEPGVCQRKPCPARGSSSPDVIRSLTRLLSKNSQVLQKCTVYNENRHKSIDVKYDSIFHHLSSKFGWALSGAL